MDNLKLYNVVATVPDEAKKTITAGRIKGMTDINPMWRIKTLTEQFGVCGFGWKYTITDKRIMEGADGTVCAFVDIDLFVKINDKWSEAIQGTGGSQFVSIEKNGKYTNDECFKMALTDAISVACKSLGIGANVYWSGGGGSKYRTDNQDEPQSEPKATPKQIEVLKKNYTGSNLAKLLEMNSIEKIEDLPMVKASELIGKLKKKAEGN